MEMIACLSKAVRSDPDLRKEFKKMRDFCAVVVAQEDSARLSKLGKRGGINLGIRVGELPWQMGPGLALMYDAAVVKMRTTDKRIDPERIGVQAMRVLKPSFENLFSLVGKSSITALELALEDDDLADRLRHRGDEIGTSFRAPLPPGICEHCQIIIEGDDGEVIESKCGTEEECQVMGIIILILVVIWLLDELWDWLT